MLEQLNVPLSRACSFCTKENPSSDCALFLFRCLFSFNIKHWLARLVNLIQTIKPSNQRHSNITHRELRHVPASCVTSRGSLVQIHLSDFNDWTRFQKLIVSSFIWCMDCSKHVLWEGLPIRSLDLIYFH